MNNKKNCIAFKETFILVIQFVKQRFTPAKRHSVAQKMKLT